MFQTPMVISGILFALLMLGSDQSIDSKYVKGKGNPGRIPKWSNSSTIGNSAIVEGKGFIGIGVTTPGEKLHLGDGNLLIEGGGETAIKVKRDEVFDGGPSGNSTFPIFQLGRIIKAGDGDPELRFMYSDDNTPERTVFEIDRKGIVASVKTDRGCHFEGFLSTTDPEPVFRLNSYPKMRLEMGGGGSISVDVALQREDPATLVFITGQTERVRIDSSGQVGVGTNNPAFVLDVAGAAHASSFVTSSDARLKDNVIRLDQVLDKLEGVRGVSFDWNERYESLGRSTGHREIGVIAQELEIAFPELVSQWSDQDYLAVDYGRLTAVLIEAVKELRAEKNAQIKQLKDLVTLQQQQIAALEEQSISLVDRLAAIQSIAQADARGENRPDLVHPDRVR
ncbi:MAG: tail fiber domain-containing protein [Acidobacteriota bacterium]